MNINIVGNGFDLAHGYKTAYKDFKEHLEKAGEKEDVWQIKLLLKYIKESGRCWEMWSNLEEEMPNLIEGLFTEYAFLTQEERNKIPYEINYDSRKVFKFIMDTFWNEFSNWLRDIDWITGEEARNRTKQKKQLSFFMNNFFTNENVCNISFNYIETIKDVYDKEPTINIHGTVSYPGVVPIFGNSKDYDQKHMQKVIKKNIDKDESIHKGKPLGLTFDSWNRTLAESFQIDGDKSKKRFKKDVPEILKKLENNLLLNVSNLPDEHMEINVFGHSFGELDWPHFQKIDEILSNKFSDTLWNIYYRTNEDKKKIELFLKEVPVKNYKLICSKNILLNK